MSASTRVLDTSSHAPPSRGALRRVGAAGFVGTTIEWYDFYVYGTAAALVFGPLFFPGGDAAIGVIKAFGAYAVGFAGRPLGSVIAGHLGDRVGRRAVLVATLVVMGACTALIGVLPTHEAIGVWAPVLLVALRFVQGLAVGGEWGGAVLLTVEHAPPGRRGFMGSITQTGSAAGLLLASGVFVAARFLLSDAQFLAWGWRVPFLASAVLVVVGLAIRLKVTDSPLFLAAKNSAQVVRSPVTEVWRTSRRELLLTTGLRLSQIGVFVTYTVFSLSYIATRVGPGGEGVGLTGVLIAAALGLASTPLWGALSDRVGRRPLYRFGAVFSALFVFPYFLLVSTGQPLLVIAALVIGVNIGHDSMYGPQAAWFAELFGTTVRYSGASIGYAVGAVIGGGITPVVAAALLALDGGHPWYVAAYVVALSLPTIAAAWLAPETLHRDLTAPTRPLPRPDVEPTAVPAVPVTTSAGRL
jgi:MHS family shikimate/dehydroshikimate transporter-like MFS transporter